MVDSLTGNLLVASSLMEDPIFAGGVCLVVHQDETNVVGVMLNRPMRPSAQAIASMLGKKAGETGDDGSVIDNRIGDQLPAPEAPASVPDDQPDANPWRALHFGGPLSGPVVAIHQISQYAEAETGSGIYVAAQREHLEDLIRTQDSPFRLIVGHLGWSNDQLQQEIDAGLWHLVPATADTVFSSSKDMWARLIRRATSNSLARWIGVPDAPQASQLN